MVAEHGDLIWPSLPQKEEVLDLSNITKISTNPRVWMLLKNKEDRPAKVLIKYRLP